MFPSCVRRGKMVRLDAHPSPGPSIASLGSRSQPRRTVRPNPSVNATSNGMAPGPRSTVAYHVPRGPGAMPSAARYLKR
jgi:hypothetical protein